MEIYFFIQGSPVWQNIRISHYKKKEVIIIYLIYTVHLIHLGLRKDKSAKAYNLTVSKNKLYRADIVDIDGN